MSSFAITSSDLTPSPIPAADYALLTAGISSLDALIVSCEETFVSWCGGLLTTSANLALAKPQVVYLVVWTLHFQLAQNADYKVPDAVQALYKSVQAWATNTGQRLLSAEGTVQQPGAASIQYDAPTHRYTRDQMDLL